MARYLVAILLDKEIAVIGKNAASGNYAQQQQHIAYIVFQNRMDHVTRCRSAE